VFFSYVIYALIFGFIFKQGKWKTVQV